MEDQNRLKELLTELGVDTSALTEGEVPKVVVVHASMKQARGLMSAARDQTVMARVDQETALELDAWVEVGLAKSRSEAAALFLREGLNLRKAELTQMSDALAALRIAQDNLRKQAMAVMGLGEASSESSSGATSTNDGVD